MSSEDPGSGGIRAARGLRQAPPQRTPFNPDTGPAFRHRSTFNQSPQPSTSSAGGNNSINSSSNPSSAYFVASNYEPRPQIPISTREVITPGNRPILFARQRESPAPTETPDPIRHLGLGSSANIYMRCSNGLRSGIPAEVDFALHHLVKVSCERGDRYRFDQFPFLADGLIEKALEITLLCTGTAWEVDYDSTDLSERDNVLNGVVGTFDILARLERLPITLPDDTLEDHDFANRLRQIKEAVLVLRNMVMLKDNVVYLAEMMPNFRDFVAIGLNVPEQPRFNEIRNNALDMAEQMTRLWNFKPNDPVFVSLLKCLDSHDRYHNLTALHAINRFSMEREEESNRFQSFPLSKMRIIMNWTYLELDPELLGAALDFLYQYTALQENIEDLLQHFNLQTTLIPRLITLLLFECKHARETHVRKGEKRAPAPTDIPTVPSDLMMELLKFTETERSTRWLRSCCVEDKECEITQIALWQAYQSHFASVGSAAGAMLPAADFIKNVTSTFTHAQAQVIHETSPKFIIKGIRPLEVAHTIDGYPYLPCKWVNPNTPGGMCGTMFPTVAKLRDHLFGEHLKLKRNSSGDWDFSSTDSCVLTCHWEGCTMFSQRKAESATVIGGHVMSHYPRDRDETKPAPVPRRKIVQERETITFHFYDTPVDEKGEPIGIAYTAALILRNIVRNLPNERAGREHGNQSWNTVLFLSKRRRLFELFDMNRSLKNQICDVACAIE